MAKNSLKYRLFFSGLLLAAVFANLQRPALAQPTREQLLNGLTVMYSARPGDPTVFLRLRTHSGAAFDLAGKAGTMALLGDAFFPEAETREYVREQLGGTLEVSTTL